MIRVAGITSGRDVPSTRFRVRQHTEKLAQLGVSVSEYCPAISKYQPMPMWPKGVRSSYVPPLHALWLMAKLATRVPAIIGSYQADVAWLSREMLPGYFTLERFIHRPLVFDVDDAIWLGKPFGQKAAREIAQRSETIIAGNDYIAEWFSAYCKDVVVIPTAVDTQQYVAESARDFGDYYIAGWIGTSGNMKYLEAVQGGINRFLKEGGNRRILVVSDDRPKLSSIDPAKILYEPWSPDSEVRMIQNMNVGLMPLEDNEWVKGKCSFKMLQYMACGKPVIVSPVGMNVEVLGMGHVGEAAITDDDWYSSLTELSGDESQGSKMGALGRRVVEEKFSTDIITRQLSELFWRLA